MGSQIWRSLMETTYTEVDSHRCFFFFFLRCKGSSESVSLTGDASTPVCLLGLPDELWKDTTLPTFIHSHLHLLHGHRDKLHALFQTTWNKRFALALVRIQATNTIFTLKGDLALSFFLSALSPLCGFHIENAKKGTPYEEFNKELFNKEFVFTLAFRKSSF